MIKYFSELVMMCFWECPSCDKENREDHEDMPAEGEKLKCQKCGCEFTEFKED